MFAVTMKSLIAISIVFSLVLAKSRCAPGRFGTVDQYRPSYVSEDSDDHSDADESDDNYYYPEDTITTLTETSDSETNHHNSDYDGDYYPLPVVVYVEVSQDHTQMPCEDEDTTTLQPELTNVVEDGHGSQNSSETLSEPDVVVTDMPTSTETTTQSH